MFVDTQLCGIAGVFHLNVGGMRSGVSKGGRGKPDMAMSIKCMARINSSAVNFPSWSISDKFL